MVPSTFPACLLRQQRRLTRAYFLGNSPIPLPTAPRPAPPPAVTQLPRFHKLVVFTKCRCNFAGMQAWLCFPRRASCPKARSSCKLRKTLRAVRRGRLAVRLQKRDARMMLIPWLWLTKDLHRPGRTYRSTENDIIWQKGCCARLPVTVQHPSPLAGGGRSVSAYTGTAL